MRDKLAAIEQILRVSGVDQPEHYPCELAESDGTKLSKERRKELLRELRAGEPVELELRIVATAEPEKPSPLPAGQRKLANANFTRFRREEMPAFARSFRDRPFLADHDRGDMAKIGGRILSSEMANDVMVQTVSLVKPWAVEAALDGTMRGFSIGWDPAKRGLEGIRESAFCTVCDCSLLECNHFPGDVVKLESGAKVIAELEWRNVRGAEVSAVAFPAVKGTSIEEIQQALSEARRVTIQQGKTDMNIRELLGLASDASDEEVERAIKARDAELVAAKEANSKTATELAATKATLAAKEEAEKASNVNMLVEQGRSTGKWAPNSKLEKSVLELAAVDFDRAKSLAEALPTHIPIGGVMQSERKAGEAASPADEFAQTLSEEYGYISRLDADIVRDQFRQLGLTESDLEEYGQHKREENMVLEIVKGY